ncbi:hypothetical protein PTSG_09440 [Salpingoeca rosetta]|uniref:COMM domain-containing protein 1 n=1 Tax=Salpingoeca rosetta (strain ATCC 50818 / BSB-021) TaxID=946362 RepID=F2UMM4_SALR5|nr:uncharacterized protein PTSG_09440 [Salpingoeca rosetta]EGD78373.1 hypothetical protein PTSG_09440 [Salpingoeca rosetta]|eukprot:XP_004989696.1 hypothetical protein PTSG_09440 [Salpingoeca rosetta]
MATTAKGFQQVCTAVARRKYFGDDIADSDIHEAVAPDVTADVFAQTVTLASNLIDDAVNASLELSQLAECLEDKGLTLSEEQQAGFGKFWKSYKPKINHALAQASAWNTQLQDINWRVDVTTQTAAQDEVNEPTAVLEFVLNDGEHVHVEADKAGVDKLKIELSRIAAALEQAQAS